VYTPAQDYVSSFRDNKVYIHYLSPEVLALYEPSGWLEVDLGKPETVSRIKIGESK
jgi:hypothetical protein